MGELGSLVTHDVLAHSFSMDLLVFVMFQGWLVRDENERRRRFLERRRERWVVFWVGWVLPFLGLVWYLLKRPKRLSDKWGRELG